MTELKVSKKKVEEFNKTLLNPEGDKNADSFFMQFYMQSGTL